MPLNEAELKEFTDHLLTLKVSGDYITKLQRLNEKPETQARVEYSKAWLDLEFYRIDSSEIVIIPKEQKKKIYANYKLLFVLMDGFADFDQTFLARTDCILDEENAERASLEDMTQILRWMKEELIAGKEPTAEGANVKFTEISPPDVSVVPSIATTLGNTSSRVIS